jgi:hypothetical protein
VLQEGVICGEAGEQPLFELPKLGIEHALCIVDAAAAAL